MQTHIVVSDLHILNQDGEIFIRAWNVVQIRQLVIKEIHVIHVTLGLTPARLLLQQTRTTGLQERNVANVQLDNTEYQLVML
ncbi:MAG: hypothetical protein CMJ39_00775 [Phycisphaerae bacterium]|nr:hypothetical protein [Phycisphaerae bacterium]